MKIGFTADGWSDYLYWQETDPAFVRRLNLLIKEAARTPFSGIGKPEPLRGPYAGWWSRRVNGEHRLTAFPGRVQTSSSKSHSAGTTTGAEAFVGNLPFGRWQARQRR